MKTETLSHDETGGEIDSTRRPITEPRPSTPHLHQAQRDLFASEERAPALDGEGTVRAWECASTDITERTQTEHLLRLSEERFQLTFDNAPVGMALVSLDGLFVRGNHALSEILGYSSEDLAGLRFQEITHPDDLKRDLELIDELLRDEIRRYELAKRYIRKDGSLVHTVLHVALVRDRAGKPLHFISQIQDVTERKRAQEAQRINDERFRLLTTHLPVAVFQADTDGRFTYVNDRWHTLCNLAPEEAVGSLWTATIHPDDRPRVVEAWGAATREQRELSLECRFQARDGESRWASASVAAMRDEAGRIIGYFGSFTDITELKRAEELARQSQERVIEAQRATLAELSTPLIPISGEIMIMPLIGAVDPQRARQVLHTLLTGISASRARVAILDITGVPTADEQVANALVNAAQAVRLLGAQTVLSGVRPEVAQILAGLGADLRGIVTCGDLQAAIGYALRATRRRA